MSSDDEIRIGISACLLGERVRWNGDHRRDSFLVDTVGRLVKFVPVCPEMEAGMGTPRPPIRLVRRGGEVRLIETASGLDHTDAMDAFAAQRAQELARLDLSGFILKKDSPSCGLERVCVVDESGVPSKCGRGRFAEALIAALPQLPVEEEGRLHDPFLRENFFERVYAWRRLALFFRGPWSIGGLVEFHSREKLLLLAHEPEGCRALGRIVAHARKRPREKLEREYRSRFMETMRRHATAGRHVNALQHMAGHVSEPLDAAGRKEMREAIDDCGRGLVPVVVPMTLIKHHVRRFGVDYLARQTYLDPHPKELMLRNHAGARR